MGYSTNFEITAVGFKDPDQVEFFEFKLKKISGYTFQTTTSDITYSGILSDSKWYDCVEDCTALSIAFPDVLIEVEGDGEESGDFWRARFRNGESEKITAEIVFPEFKEIT